MEFAISRYLDAAVLKPDMSREEARAAIEECVAVNARTACVRPCDIELAKEVCAGSDTGVCVVLAFPHGQQTSESKADEANRYVSYGVTEIDMVANIGWIRSHEWDSVTADIEAVVKVCKPAGVPLKVIFETSYLTEEEIAHATECSIQAGADFVKTSTGFGGEGATDRGVQIMLETAQGRCKVKPSGGIRDFERAKMLIDMGAHRLGVGYNSCRAIIEGGAAEGSGY
ncbi:MAG: deoxyribose-phosphate aldolase [Verrucomicrobiota bacterium]